LNWQIVADRETGTCLVLVDSEALVEAVDGGWLISDLDELRRFHGSVHLPPWAVGAVVFDSDPGELRCAPCHDMVRYIGWRKP